LQFIHFIILPLFILGFSIILQNWLNREEFIQYFKLYFIGLLIGIIILIILNFTNPIFYGAAKYYTILLKTLFTKGLLFTIFTLVLLLLYFHINDNIKFTNCWSLTSIISFSFLSGIYTVINIQECLTDNFPDYLTFYLIFIPLIFFASLILGLGIYRFFYHFEVYIKILWLILIVFILIISFAGYYFLTFYNFYYKYIYILLFLGIYLIFEFNDFKSFRS
jgi:hypothetical protein